MSDTVAVSVPAQVAKAARRRDAKPTSSRAQRPRGRRRPLWACGPWRRRLRPPARASRSNRSRPTPPAASSPKARPSPTPTVRLYLNQADVAEAKTQSDGRWSLTIKAGMSPGGYVMRADEIKSERRDRGCERQYARSTIRTCRLAPALQALRDPASAEPSAAPSPADPVVPSVQTKRVATGHTLWALSQSYYGDPTRYPAIVEANRAQIHNPMSSFPARCSSFRSRTRNSSRRDAPRPPRRDASRASRTEHSTTRLAVASSTRTSGRCARDCAAPTPTTCLTAIANAW